MYPSHRCPISDVYVDTELPSVHTKTASGQDNGCMEDLGCMKGDPDYNMQTSLMLMVITSLNSFTHKVQCNFVTKHLI